jgi:PTS system N-acetylgalactosamine-specific IIC component
VILGYICIAYLDLPVMAIALVGAVFAMIDYYNQEKRQELSMTFAQQGGIEEDGI